MNKLFLRSLMLCMLVLLTACSPVEEGKSVNVLEVKESEEVTITEFSIPVTESPEPDEEEHKLMESVEIYYPGDSWREALPSEVGIDDAVFKGMHEYISKHELTYDSILVIRGGYLCHEEYAPGYGADEFRALFSATKSINSLLAGIAIEKGLIPSIGSPIISFFPDYLPLEEQEEKESITLEHVLTMTCGLDWDEYAYDYGDERNIYNRWVDSADRIAFVLSLSIASEPGWKFNYNTAASHLIPAVIQRVSGMSAEEFSAAHLFRPLGIPDDHIYWPKDQQGINKGGGLCMFSPDLARIGYLILNDGVWEEKQIISSHWISDSLKVQQYASYTTGFGYHWWIRKIGDFEVYAAEGYKEQRLYIIPDLDMIVVFTGDILSSTDHAFELLRKLIDATDPA